MPLAFLAHFMYLNSTFISHTTIPGGGKKGVAIRPYPSPGPPPFIPNAFLKCEALTGFDSYWAVSRKKEIELDKKLSLAKKSLHPKQHQSRAKKPNTNQMPSGIKTIHPFRKGFASPRQCKTASDLPAIFRIKS